MIGISDFSWGIKIVHNEGTLQQNKNIYFTLI